MLSHLLEFLRRRLLYPIARQLRNWALNILPPGETGSPALDPEIPGPPADWIARVRRSAPELLRRPERGGVAVRYAATQGPAARRPIVRPDVRPAVLRPVAAARIPGPTASRPVRSPVAQVGNASGRTLRPPVVRLTASPFPPIARTAKAPLPSPPQKPRRVLPPAKYQENEPKPAPQLTENTEKPRPHASLPRANEPNQPNREPSPAPRPEYSALPALWPPLPEPASLPHGHGLENYRDPTNPLPSRARQQAVPPELPRPSIATPAAAPAPPTSLVPPARSPFPAGDPTEPQWPDLPPELPDDPEWAASARSAQRVQRLQLEQRGGTAWSA